MKTGEEIKNRALELLNYTNQNGRTDSTMFADITARSLALVNQIYAECWYALEGKRPFVPLPTLSAVIALPPRVIEGVMPFGVAMLMAQSIGDGDNQGFMADLYNQKRATLTQTQRRKDVMPRAI